MDHETRQSILDVISAGQDLTLATIRSDGWPQATTVSYVGDGLTIYFAVGTDSQKARNIESCDKVSVAIDLPYKTWDDIKSISMAATAAFVTDEEELGWAGTLMMEKFPQVADLPSPDPNDFRVVKLTPKVISLLDYSKGFGHTSLVEAV
ncbi:MAG: pyridoxamine 5'-phosphate oxidase family protein [Alphaproteobacteria bacterium]